MPFAALVVLQQYDVSSVELELIPLFENSFDLTSFHFWSYKSNSCDVDSIVLEFRDSSYLSFATVELDDPMPGLSGSVASAIYAQEYPVALHEVASDRGSNHVATMIRVAVQLR